MPCHAPVISSVLPEVRESLEKALDKAREDELRMPAFSTLCHYTKEAGLRGILSTDKIWATKAQGHRTDPLELKHADSMIRSVAGGLGSSTKYTPDERLWFNALRLLG